MQLSEMVKKARKNKGVSLQLAAIQCGVSSTVIHYIETGKMPHPKMDVIRKISDYFAIPYDDLCVAAQRIPVDVYEKIVGHRFPQAIYQKIRNYQA